jgi:hypothetical protein
VISKLVALKDIILVELCDLTSDATGLSLAAGSFPMNSRQNSPGSPDPYNTHPSGLNSGVTGSSGILNSTDWFYSSNVIRCDVSRVLYEQSRGQSGDSKTPFVFPVFAVNSMVSDPSCSGNECALVCLAIQTLSSSNAIDAVAESDLAKLAGPFMLSSLCLLEEASIVAVPYLQKASLADTFDSARSTTATTSKAATGTAINIFDDFGFLDSSSGPVTVGTSQKSDYLSIWSDDLTSFLGMDGTATTVSKNDGLRPLSVSSVSDWGFDMVYPSPSYDAFSNKGGTVTSEASQKKADQSWNSSDPFANSFGAVTTPKTPADAPNTVRKPSVSFADPFTSSFGADPSLGGNANADAFAPSAALQPTPSKTSVVDPFASSFGAAPTTASASDPFAPVSATVPTPSKSSADPFASTSSLGSSTGNADPFAVGSSFGAAPSKSGVSDPFASSAPFGSSPTVSSAASDPFAPISSFGATPATDPFLSSSGATKTTDPFQASTPSSFVAGSDSFGSAAQQPAVQASDSFQPSTAHTFQPSFASASQDHTSLYGAASSSYYGSSEAASGGWSAPPTASTANSQYDGFSPTVPNSAYPTPPALGVASPYDTGAPGQYPHPYPAPQYPPGGQYPYPPNPQYPYPPNAQYPPYPPNPQYPYPPAAQYPGMPYPPAPQYQPAMAYSSPPVAGAFSPTSPAYASTGGAVTPASTNSNPNFNPTSDNPFNSFS